MAVDINTTANNIYKHNFPSAQLQSFGLEKLTLKRLEGLQVDAILMSPPCQPFTRVGKKRDCDDVRTKSFLHILELLRQLKKKPNFLLLENVKGFEVSMTHSQFISCLEECGYHFQQFLLTPLQFDIPNCRLRYYLIARFDQPFSFSMEKKILLVLPKVDVNTDNGSSSQPIASAPLSHSSPSCDKSCNPPKVNKSKPFVANDESQASEQSNTDNHTSNSESITRDLDCSSVSRNSDCSNSMSATNNNCNNSASAENNSSLIEDNNAKAKDDIVIGSSCGESKSESDICQLKDAGRNMRYCEEEDPYITSRSRPLSDFMETGSEDDLREYLLPDKELTLFVIMDIVFPALKKSTCFTKRYGHYIEGAGSVVQMTQDVQAVRAASELKVKAVGLKNRSEWGDKELDILRKLKLRYFTPREVANLLCFPSDFGYPDDVNKAQLYRVLGNSLNVHVVAELIKLMIHTPVTAELSTK